MSEAVQEWLENELRDFEPVWKSFKSRQQKRHRIWMAAAVAGLVVLGFVAGYSWTYVLRVHLLIGIGLAAFIWLCVRVTGRGGTMQDAKKQLEEALSSLSPSEQESFVRQEFGRADFFNTSDDVLPARLLAGPDFWLYFRNVCQICRVSDMEALEAREEKVCLHYKTGSTRVRQKVCAGVSLVVEYRQGSSSDTGQPDTLYLASWEQLKTAKELIARHCPKAHSLWKDGAESSE